MKAIALAAPGAVTSSRASSTPQPAKVSAAPKQSQNEDDNEVHFTFDTPAGEPPLMSIYETNDEAARHAPKRGKIFLVVMVVFVALIAAYYAWSKFGPGSTAHPGSGTSAPQQKVPLTKLDRRLTGAQWS